MLRPGAGVRARERTAGGSGVAVVDGAVAGSEDRSIGREDADGEVGARAERVSTCGQDKLGRDSKENVEFPVRGYGDVRSDVCLRWEVS